MGAVILVAVGSLFVWRGQGVGTGQQALARSRTSSIRPPGTASAGTEASKRARLVSSDLPADCVPNPAGPPIAPYELGLVGTATDGALNTGSVTVSGINAKFCGIVTLVTGTPPCGATGSVDSPPDGQRFGGPLSAVLTLVPKMTPTIGFVANPGTITGGFSCTSSQNGLAVAFDAHVSGTTAPLFGVSCNIAVSIPLTGAVTGPLTATAATLKSSWRGPAHGAAFAHLPGPGGRQRRDDRRRAAVGGNQQRHVARGGFALPTGALDHAPRPEIARPTDNQQKEDHPTMSHTDENTEKRTK